MEALKQIIEQSFGLRPEHFPPEVQNSVDEVIKLLQQGKLRVAEKIDGEWVTHEWIKKAVLLSFQLYPNKMVRAGDLSFFDKVPSRFDHFSEADWKESGIRCVPTAVARHGSYIAPSVVLMPSFVNIGAYIGENTMVDTWSTVGSCAQVGKNCHLSGGGGQLLFPRMAGRLSVVMIVTAEGQIVMPKQFIHAEGLLFARYKTKICRGEEVTILI